MDNEGITIVGGAILLKSLSEFQKNLEKEAAKGLKIAAVKVHNTAKQNLTDDGTVNTGLLRSSVKWRISDNGKTAEVYSNKKYAAPVEFGSRPHFPPIAPLSDWSRKKLGIDLGYVIARKISLVGTKAKPFLFPALEAERPNFASDIISSAKAVFR